MTTPSTHSPRTDPLLLRRPAASLRALDRDGPLAAAVDASLSRAVEHCLGLQGADGSWEVLPDPRVFETALCGVALSQTPGGLDHQAVARARAWVRGAAPQDHHPVARLLEETLRRILLGEGGPVDLRAAEIEAPSSASRLALLHTLALHAGLEVRASASEEQLRRRIAGEYERSSQARLKQWSKIELIATHILLQARAGDGAAVAAAGFELAQVQAPRPDFFLNPVSAALAYLALCVAAPASASRFRVRARLLDDQRPDGTWRFCTSDVWDTSLLVRAFGQHPGFARAGLSSALDFLQATQNDDGGWPFRARVESDNDTTGAVVLALRGTLHGERTIDRALAYLGRVQMEGGLWRTWQFRDDPPVEDVVAHVLSALDAYPGRHAIATDAARRWLVAETERRGSWAASWYRGVPYAVAEIGRALGPEHPRVRRAVDDLAAAQGDDGGWSPDLAGPSTASATGQTLMAIADRHPERAARALRYLVDTQRADGTWPGAPDMYGPRPLLSHSITHTQAFVVGGIMAAVARRRPSRGASPLRQREPAKGRRRR
ncbi:MAG: prenyltransferase/squalene oxidase repeat-containing protein [Nannocystaceae bacterium]